MNIYSQISFKYMKLKIFLLLEMSHNFPFKRGVNNAEPNLVKGMNTESSIFRVFKNLIIKNSVMVNTWEAPAFKRKLVEIPALFSIFLYFFLCL